MYEYTLKNKNVTNWGVKFNQSSPINIQYELWYNSTQSANLTDVFGRTLLGLMRGIDESIGKLLLLVYESVGFE